MISRNLPARSGTTVFPSLGGCARRVFHPGQQTALTRALGVDEQVPMVEHSDWPSTEPLPLDDALALLREPEDCQ